MTQSETRSTLVTIGDLAAHLDDPAWVTIDCRFDLAVQQWGYEEYLKSHIAGAVYAHLDHDLSSPRTPFSGRHPLPHPDAFIESCSRWGISPKSQVVVYDSLGGAYAARLWWLLQDYGHTACAVLDGSWQKWLAEWKPIRSGLEKRPSQSFTGSPGHMPVISTQEMEKLDELPEKRLIDARSPERFRGENELIDPVAGHIPGAVNRFHGQNLNQAGEFLPPERLSSEFLDILKDTPAEEAIVYCGSGVTSCHHILAMKTAGLPAPRLYAGSWSEWIRNPARPVIKE